VRTHVDWVTFTMPMIYGIDTPAAYADAIARGFLDMFGEQIRADVFGGEWKRNEKSRAPYTDSWKMGEGGIALFASPNLAHCCVEISGHGCELLLEAKMLDLVIRHCRERVTRIDIACDIETDVTPLEFVSHTSHERMRSSGHYVSETGETCYVGSQKSDRFCRVYRYNSPHPRSALLRIEYVFRREQAKSVVNAYLESGEQAVSHAAGKAFGFSHDCWQPEESGGANITVISDNHKGGNTVFWLVDTVAPCFQRLVREGVIKDAEQFINRYFLTE